MKFLCEQCKAKYQIADDKVAGKTVRMKCRKCGHMIEVRAEVTETSVAKGLPSADDKKPAKPSALRGGLATSLTARPPSPKTNRPDALAGAFNRQVKRPETPPESTASVDMLDSAAANGWYVAINGVPVGPIRVSELRRKAANGAITEDSLVWREGLEEWRPVRSVTEIAELVREAAMSGRPSLVTPPPPADMHHMRPSAPPPPTSMSPRPPPARPAPRAPEAPKPPSPALAARSNVVPFTGRLATAEKREEEEDIDIEEELEPISSSSAAALATPAGSVPGPLAERPSLVTADPFALPPPAAVAAIAAPAAVQSAPIVMPAQTAASTSIAVSPPIVTSDQGAKKPPNWLVIGLLIAFGAFGVTAAVFMFKPQPPAPQPTVIVQPIPVPNAPVTADKPTTETPAPTTTSTEATGSKVAQVGKPGTSKATQPTQPAGKTGGLGLDPSLIGGTGPNVGPNGSTPKAAGGALTSDQVEQTVRNYQLGVRRTCWERSGVQTPSVNVTAKVTVASNGVVQAVDAQGNDPVVAKCIESQVKGWHFPASGETTTVNIPFKFVRQ